jgi:hypothetical protein
MNNDYQRHVVRQAKRMSREQAVGGSWQQDRSATYHRNQRDRRLRQGKLAGKRQQQQQHVNGKSTARTLPERTSPRARGSPFSCTAEQSNNKKSCRNCPDNGCKAARVIVQADLAENHEDSAGWPRRRAREGGESERAPVLKQRPRRDHVQVEIRVRLQQSNNEQQHG